MVCKLYRRGIDYVQAVQKLFREYTGYIRARIEGTESAQITNYPVNQDEIHAKSMEEQKSIWFSGAQIRPVVRGMELALALDRRTWYNLYERNTIEKFTELYWTENGIGGWEQHKIIPDRLYMQCILPSAVARRRAAVCSDGESKCGKRGYHPGISLYAGVSGGRDGKTPEKSGKLV